MDRVTQAVTSNDLEGLKALYAPDATAETADQGTITGRDAVVAYLGGFVTAFPDASFESVHQHEIGDTAIDEGYFVGTNTGPLEAPTGERIPPTGKRVRLRECVVATVNGGLVTSHRAYFDHMDLLGQLGPRARGVIR